MRWRKRREQRGGKRSPDKKEQMEEDKKRMEELGNNVEIKLEKESDDEKNQNAT